MAKEAKGPTKTVSFRMAEDLHADLLAVAQRKGVDLSAVIIEVLLKERPKLMQWKGRADLLAAIDSSRKLGASEEAIALMEALIVDPERLERLHPENPEKVYNLDLWGDSTLMGIDILSQRMAGFIAGYLEEFLEKKMRGEPPEASGRATDQAD
jgi:hypothetical protein